MKSWVVALRIVVSLGLGVVLLYAPWMPVWTHNHFTAQYDWVAAACQNGYVRGAISGLGVTDIWVALEEVRRCLHSPRSGVTS